MLITQASYGRSMTRLTTTEALTTLAEDVVATGFDANRRRLAEVVSSARSQGIRPVLTDIVADATAPRPVRERALGRLIVALCAAAASAEPAGSATAASAA